MTARLLSVVFGLLFLLASANAQAQEALLDPSVVRNRLYSTAGRFDVSLTAGLPLGSRLTSHYLLDGAVAYNVFGTLAVEAMGGWAFSRHTGLADTLAEKFLRREDVQQTDELSDLWEMKAHGAVGLRWAPIYGKLSLVAELPVHFQAFVWAGGGVASLQRESITQCSQVADRAAGICNAWREESRVAPVGSVALGMRFFLGEHHGLRLEVRDWAFRDRYDVSVVRAEWEANEPTGTRAAQPGLTHLVQFELGYSFLF